MGAVCGLFLGPVTALTGPEVSWSNGLIGSAGGALFLAFSFAAVVAIGNSRARRRQANSSGRTS